MKKRGSILIWTMFMSLFIVSFFVAFQSGFLNFLNSSEKLGNKVQTNVTINSIIDELKANPEEQQLTDGYSIKSLDYNTNGYSGNLSFNEAREYVITSTGGDTSLDLEVTSGGPLEYNVISYSGASDESVYNSGIIFEGNSGSLNLDNTKKINMIAVRNLGGYSEYFLQKGFTDLLAPDNTYIISRDYGTWQDPIRTVKVTNFKKRTKLNNYNQFSIFLNSSNYE